MLTTASLQVSQSRAVQTVLNETSLHSKPVTAPSNCVLTRTSLHIEQFIGRSVRVLDLATLYTEPVISHSKHGVVRASHLSPSLYVCRPSLSCLDNRRFCCRGAEWRSVSHVHRDPGSVSGRDRNLGAAPEVTLRLVSQGVCFIGGLIRGE